MLQCFTLNTSVEIICFLIALICLHNDAKVEWKLFIVFLFITCITEMAGVHFKKMYLADRIHNPPNIWLYNILLLFQICFFSMIFEMLLSKYFNIKIVIFGIGTLLLAIHDYELYEHGIFAYNELTNTVMLVFIVLGSLYYFYLLLKDENYVDLKYAYDFWWVSGILFFYFGTTACNIFFRSLSPEKIKSIKHLTYYIYNAFNIILYSSWGYSFICRRWLTSQGLL